MRIRAVARSRLHLIGITALTFLLPTMLHAEPGSSGASPLAGWWLMFEDQRLSELIEDALRNAPDSRIARLRLEEAQAVRSRTLREYDPRGSASAVFVRQQSSAGSIVTSGDGDTGTGFGASAGGLSIATIEIAPQVDLDLFGRRQANRAVAVATYDQAKIERDESQRRLTLSVGFALNEARLLVAQRKAASAEATLAKSILVARRALISRGMAPAADAAQLVAEAADAQRSVIDLEARIEIAKRELLVLTGRSESGAKDLMLGKSVTPPAEKQDVDSRQVFQRADIMLAEAELRAAVGHERLKKLALYPSFSLLGAASLTDISGPGGYSSGLWTIGAGLVLPILDRGRLLAEARVASVQAEIASVNFEKAVQRAFADARNALRVVSSDHDGLKTFERAEAAAEAFYRAQQTGFTKGYVDNFAVWAAERAWLVRHGELQVMRLRQTRDIMNAIYAVGAAWIDQPVQNGRKG